MLHSGTAATRAAALREGAGQLCDGGDGGEGGRGVLSEVITGSPAWHTNR